MTKRNRPVPAIALLGAFLLTGCGSGEPEPMPPETPSFFGGEAEASAARPPLSMIEARQPPEPPQLAAVPRTPQGEDVTVVTARQPPPPPNLSPMIDTPPTPLLPVPPVYEIGFDADGFGQWVPAPGNAIEGAAVSDGRRAAVRLRSSDPTAVPEPMDGVFVPVPAAIVDRYAGREIEVTVRARVPEGTTQGTIHVATVVTIGAEFDSGWRRFAPDTAFQSFRFRWTVPQSAPTLPNRIGIRAVPGGPDAAILVSVVSLGIVGDQ